MSEAGLTDKEAADRLRRHGANVLPSTKTTSWFSVVMSVAKEPMIALLLLCSGIYLAIGERHDGILLLASVGVVAAITIYQENRSSRALQSLRDLSAPRALVRRNGALARIASAEVVRDDILVLNEGDRVPADALLLTASGLQIDESLITGESVPAPKKPGDLALSSTLVVSGMATARVTATGVHTEVGKIGRSLEDANRPSRTRLQVEITGVVKTFSLIAAALSLIVILTYGISRNDWSQGMLSALAAAMSLLPEEFPVILTIFLALGAWRLSKRKVLVRNPGATENLGAITVLCTDKTGTLTRNQMEVAEVWLPNNISQTLEGQTDLSEDVENLLFRAALACPKVSADPMETAIARVLNARSPRIVRSLEQMSPLQLFPVAPGKPAITAIWKGSDGKDYGAAKGAPEFILQLSACKPDERAIYEAQASRMASSGLRVLAVAVVDSASASHDPSKLEYSFAGLIGWRDPLRNEVPDAVARCHAAGIEVLMMTGDHIATAGHIGAQAGIHGRVMTGSQMADLDEKDLRESLKDVRVFARMVPDQKLKLIQVLQAGGAIVGMTGDGVNDAPALKRADVGIAMGERGTDVAREAADIVLMDDNFASIVAGIETGRAIFIKIQRAMGYVFAVHVPIAGLAVLPVLLGLPAMLFPIHIVFIELIIDPACTLVFDAAAEDSSAMTRPPRHLNQPLCGRADIARSMLQGALIMLGLVTMFAGSMQLGWSEEKARAVTFISFVVGNIGLIALFSSLKDNARNLVFWSVAAAATLALAAIFSMDGLRAIFHFGALTLQETAISLAAGLVFVVLTAIARNLIKENCE